MVQSLILRRKSILFLTLCLSLVLSAGAVRADDEEDPIFPSSPICAPIVIGEIEVEALDAAGDAVDVWSVVEPDVTVFLTTNDCDLSSSDKLVVDSQAISTVCIMASF